jgi:lipopolysaccharide export system protein LptA
VSRASRASQAAAGSAFFNSKEPVYGSAAEFRYDAAAGQARYLGTLQAPARLRQQDTEVFGNELVLHQEKQDLTATGNVDSTFVMAPRQGAGGSRAPVKYRVTAQSLVYTEATRTARYVGAPATLRSTDGETVANNLVLILARTARTIDRLEAAGAVRTTLEGGREAHGETLAYDAATDSYTLEGRSLTLITKDADGTCSVQTGRYMEFSSAVGAPEFPASRNAEGAPIRPRQTCPPSLAARK